MAYRVGANAAVTLTDSSLRFTSIRGSPIAMEAGARVVVQNCKIFYTSAATRYSAGLFAVIGAKTVVSVADSARACSPAAT